MVYTTISFLRLIKTSSQLPSIPTGVYFVYSIICPHRPSLIGCIISIPSILRIVHYLTMQRLTTEEQQYARIEALRLDHMYVDADSKGCSNGGLSDSQINAGLESFCSRRATVLFQTLATICASRCATQTKAIADARAILAVPKDDPKREKYVQDYKYASQDWVAKYRANKDFRGRLSY